MRKPAVVLIIAIFAFAGLVSASDSGQSVPGNGLQKNGIESTSAYCWEGKQVTQALFLTDEEKMKLTEIRDKYLSEIEDLGRVLKEQRQTLDGIMGNADFSARDAREQSRKIINTLSMIQQKRFELQLQEREILGPERLAKLLAMDKLNME